MFRFVTLCALMWPFMLNAHPHVFINTALKVDVSDTGQAVAVEVTWIYDELYSLLILEDLELDSDYDGVLSDKETKLLSGFDMRWDPGYEGDLYITQNGNPIRLGPPQSLGAELKDGRVVTRHRRLFEASADGLILQAYDPGFYSAYEMNSKVDVTGGCSANVLPADIEAASNFLEELLFAMPQAQAEEEFPKVGKNFADTVTLTCK